MPPRKAAPAAPATRSDGRPKKKREAPGPIKAALGPADSPLHTAYFVVPDATKKAMDRDVQAVEERAQQRAQHIHDILNGTATAEPSDGKKRPAAPPAEAAGPPADSGLEARSFGPPPIALLRGDDQWWFTQTADSPNLHLKYNTLQFEPFMQRSGSQHVRLKSPMRMLGRPRNGRSREEVELPEMGDQDIITHFGPEDVDRYFHDAKVMVPVLRRLAFHKKRLLALMGQAKCLKYAVDPAFQAALGVLANSRPGSPADGFHSPRRIAVVTQAKSWVTALKNAPPDLQRLNVKLELVKAEVIETLQQYDAALQEAYSYLPPMSPSKEHVAVCFSNFPKLLSLWKDTQFRDDVVQREYERYYAKNAEAVEAEGVPDLATRGVFEEEARRMEDEVFEEFRLTALRRMVQMMEQRMRIGQPPDAETMSDMLHTCRQAGVLINAGTIFLLGPLGSVNFEKFLQYTPGDWTQIYRAMKKEHDYYAQLHIVKQLRLVLNLILVEERKKRALDPTLLTRCQSILEQSVFSETIPSIDCAALCAPAFSYQPLEKWVRITLLRVNNAADQSKDRRRDQVISELQRRFRHRYQRKKAEEQMARAYQEGRENAARLIQRMVRRWLTWVKTHGSRRKHLHCVQIWQRLIRRYLARLRREKAQRAQEEFNALLDEKRRSKKKTHLSPRAPAPGILGPAYLLQIRGSPARQLALRFAFYEVIDQVLKQIAESRTARAAQQAEVNHMSDLERRLNDKRLRRGPRPATLGTAASAAPTTPQTEGSSDLAYDVEPSPTRMGRSGRNFGFVRPTLRNRQKPERRNSRGSFTSTETVPSAGQGPPGPASPLTSATVVLGQSLRAAEAMTAEEVVMGWHESRPGSHAASELGSGRYSFPDEDEGSKPSQSRNPSRPISATPLAMSMRSTGPGVPTPSLLSLEGGALSFTRGSSNDPRTGTATSPDKMVPPLSFDTVPGHAGSKMDRLKSPGSPKKGHGDRRPSSVANGGSTTRRPRVKGRDKAHGAPGRQWRGARPSDGGSKEDEDDDSESWTSSSRPSTRHRSPATSYRASRANSEFLKAPSGGHDRSSSSSLILGWEHDSQDPVLALRDLHGLDSREFAIRFDRANAVASMMQRPNLKHAVKMLTELQGAGKKAQPGNDGLLAVARVARQVLQHRGSQSLDYDPTEGMFYDEEDEFSMFPMPRQRDQLPRYDVEEDPVIGAKVSARKVKVRTRTTVQKLSPQLSVTAAPGGGSPESREYHSSKAPTTFEAGAVTLDGGWFDAAAARSFYTGRLDDLDDSSEGSITRRMDFGLDADDFDLFGEAYVNRTGKQLWLMVREALAIGLLRAPPDEEIDGAPSSPRPQNNMTLAELSLWILKLVEDPQASFKYDAAHGDVMSARFFAPDLSESLARNLGARMRSRSAMYEVVNRTQIMDLEMEEFTKRNEILKQEINISYDLVGKLLQMRLLAMEQKAEKLHITPDMERLSVTPDPKAAATTMSVIHYASLDQMKEEQRRHMQEMVYASEQRYLAFEESTGRTAVLKQELEMRYVLSTHLVQAKLVMSTARGPRKQTLLETKEEQMRLRYGRDQEQEWGHLCILEEQTRPRRLEGILRGKQLWVSNKYSSSSSTRNKPSAPAMIKARKEAWKEQLFAYETLRFEETTAMMQTLFDFYRGMGTAVMVESLFAVEGMERRQVQVTELQALFRMASHDMAVYRRALVVETHIKRTPPPDTSRKQQRTRAMQQLFLQEKVAWQQLCQEYVNTVGVLFAMWATPGLVGTRPVADLLFLPRAMVLFRDSLEPPGSPLMWPLAVDVEVRAAATEQWSPRSPEDEERAKAAALKAERMRTVLWELQLEEHRKRTWIDENFTRGLQTMRGWGIRYDLPTLNPPAPPPAAPPPPQPTATKRAALAEDRTSCAATMDTASVHSELPDLIGVMDPTDTPPGRGKAVPALGKRPALAEGFDVPLQAPATRLVLWFEGLEAPTGSPRFVVPKFSWLYKAWAVGEDGPAPPPIALPDPHPLADGKTLKERRKGGAVPPLRPSPEKRAKRRKSHAPKHAPAAADIAVEPAHPDAAGHESDHSQHSSRHSSPVRIPTATPPLQKGAGLPVPSSATVIVNKFVPALTTPS
eukprot:EG_transcript_90